MKYGYTGLIRLSIAFNMVMGLIAVLVSSGLALGVPLQAVFVGDTTFAFKFGCFSLWFLLIGWMVGFGLINMYPVVWTEPDGLVLSAFLFAKIRIPWGNVIDVKIRNFPYRLAIVQAHHITPFHRLYGWIYARTLKPSFIIRPQIQNYDQLIDEIKRRATGCNSQL